MVLVLNSQIFAKIGVPLALQWCFYPKYPQKNLAQWFLTFCLTFGLLNHPISSLCFPFKLFAVLYLKVTHIYWINEVFGQVLDFSSFQILPFCQKWKGNFQSKVKVIKFAFHVPMDCLTVFWHFLHMIYSFLQWFYVFVACFPVWSLYPFSLLPWGHWDDCRGSWFGVVSQWWTSSAGCKVSQACRHCSLDAYSAVWQFLVACFPWSYLWSSSLPVINHIETNIGCQMCLERKH